MAGVKFDSSKFIADLLYHDISNYNQTSRGYFEMLLAEQMGPMNDEQVRAIQICFRQTSRIQNLLDSVRLLVEMDGAPVRPERLNLDTLLQSTIQWIQRTHSEREIRVRFSPAGRMAAAESHLEMVLRHLLTNAVCHNDTELVEIDIEVEAVRPETTSTWKVLISDNGNGIEEARQDVLFDRLAIKEVHGFGVGLSLARMLVRRWGGDLWLESSDPDHGSVFGFTVPQAEVRAAIRPVHS